MRRNPASVIEVTEQQYADLRGRLEAGSFYQVVDRDGKPLRLITPSGDVVGGVGGADFVDARDYGLLPGRGTADEIRALLETALNAAAAAGKALLLQPGDYAYSGRINVTGAGGMVCLSGKAKLIASHPTYADNLINFAGPSAANPAVGFRMRNIVFDNATMPNSGLTNGASEYAGFVNLTFIRDILVQHCEVVKNYGGFLLLRTCFDAMIVDNVCRDLFKDVFHTTGGSRNIWRMRNRVYNCGDDAFATVGYVSGGDRPEFIYDFDNSVYGCRRGRAFAYVGAAHVRGRNFVDGRTVNPYQALTPNGHYARGSCAVYVASESSFNTYGCSDVKFFVDARYCGPTVVTPGGGAASNALEPVNSYSVVRIAEADAATKPLTDIEIEGSIEFSPRIQAFVTGGENISVKLRCEDNTDTEGWIGTPGTNSNQMVEFQAVRGKTTVDLNAKTCNHLAVVFTGTCRGDIDAKVKINDIVKAGAVQDAVSFLPGGVFGTVNLEVDLDWDIPGGRLDGFVDNQATVAEYNVKLTGKGSANNIAWLGSGLTADAVNMTGSPQIVTNLTDDDINLQIRGGSVTAVQTTRVGLQWARPVASVSGNVLTVAGDVSTVYTTNRHVVFLGRTPGAAELGSQHYAISAVSFSGGNTSITLASAPPAAGTYTRIAPLFTDAFTNIDGNLRKFLYLPRGRAVRVTHAAAPVILSIPAKQ